MIISCQLNSAKATKIICYNSWIGVRKTLNTSKNVFFHNSHLQVPCGNNLGKVWHQWNPFCVGPTFWFCVSLTHWCPLASLAHHPQTPIAYIFWLYFRTFSKSLIIDFFHILLEKIRKLLKCTNIQSTI